MMRDMEIRRQLTLSNGMVLIEGIGCINSPGLYLFYLNPDIEYQKSFGHLVGYSYHYGSSESIFDTELKYAFEASVYAGSRMMQKNIDIIFDLSGHKLEHALQKGIYIQNGKKYIK